MFSVIYAFPYTVVFLIICLFSFPIVLNKRKNLVVNYASEYAVFFILSIFIGLRGFIYSDYRAYYNTFKILPTLFDGFSTIFKSLSELPFEKGFLLFSIFLKTFTKNYFIYQEIQFFIEFIILYYFFKTYIKDHILLAFAFCYIFGGVIGSMQINLSRNFKSILLFLLSIKYLNKNKIHLYIILNLLGVIFHISSLFYIPLAFILTKRFSKSKYLLVFIIGNIIYLCQIRYLSSILLTITNSYNGSLSYIFKRYVLNNRWNTSYGISIGYFERCFTFLFVLKFSNKLWAQKYNVIFLNCLFLHIFSYLYLSEFKIFTDRIPLLFIFAYWVIYPQIYALYTKKMKCIFWVAFMFYSLLKLSRCNSILYLYDNALFLKYPFQERVKTLDNFYSFTGVYK